MIDQTEISLDELKCCPFCGGEAEVADILAYYKDGKAIRCKKCFARSMFVLIDSPKVNLFNNEVDESTRYTPEQAAELAAEKWNLREEAAETLHNRWIPVTEELPKTIPCGAGTEYSEAVNVLTSGRKVLTAIWNGSEFIADAAFWDAEGEEVTHWTPVLLPLPEQPKGE